MLRTLALLTVIGSAALAATAPSTAVTFNKDVLPILQQKCQECHRPGEVAPMSFILKTAVENQVSTGSN